jgi:hypothetical protein
MNSLAFFRARSRTRRSALPIERVVRAASHRLVRIAIDKMISEPLRTPHCRAVRSPTIGAINIVRSTPFTVSLAISSNHAEITRKERTCQSFHHRQKASSPSVTSVTPVML